MEAAAGAGRKIPNRSGVAVVVPCHNYGCFLTDALASIDAQSLLPDEIIIVDDGSTDDTPQVIERLRKSHPDIGVLTRTPARGVVSSINDGVNATTARLLVILSADDTISPRYIENLAAAIDETEADFAYATVHFFGARTGTWTARPFSPRRLARTNFVNTSAMFRRELFKKIGGFDASFEHFGREDWAFWIAAVDKGARGIAVPEALLDYRRHETGSRNDMSLLRIVALHAEIRRRWPRVVSRVDLVIGTALDSRVWLASQLRYWNRPHRIAKRPPV